ncbi:MAG: very short patch repair endonuclease [Paludisphaera borealis]|uniref:very short patch repair endonuclease n=1 Tax=Paludisphaera borealis TaxID=1387353 RepID=UPI00283ED5A5|nr:very short patch repair endonuclease [Paludisphaera borealis]MDR3618583.1 very short patch repair endonuclease [Paludisphaera borealis]
MADNLTPEQRRKTMQAVKGKNTSLERTLSSAFHRRGWRYRRNYALLPGKPDFVFTKARVVVFVDGDFWHGWRYPQWKHKLSDFWRAKIERNRLRDRRNFQRLRRQGWTVLRLWGHDVEKNLEASVERVRLLLEASRRVDG